MILVGMLLWVAVGFMAMVESKPYNNDGVCETIVVENGEVISKETYPCE
jgi:hypothetical protein